MGKFGKDIVGENKAQDRYYTKSIASVLFDAGTTFRALEIHNIMKEEFKNNPAVSRQELTPAHELLPKEDIENNHRSRYRLL